MRAAYSARTRHGLSRITCKTRADICSLSPSTAAAAAVLHELYSVVVFVVHVCVVPHIARAGRSQATVELLCTACV